MSHFAFTRSHERIRSDITISWLERAVHTWLRSWSVSRCSSRGLKQFWHLLLLKMFAWNFLHEFSFALDILFLYLCAFQIPATKRRQTAIIPTLFHPILDTVVMRNMTGNSSFTPRISFAAAKLVRMWVVYISRSLVNRPAQCFGWCAWVHGLASQSDSLISFLRESMLELCKR